jgi:hypothetical protein
MGKVGIAVLFALLLGSCVCSGPSARLVTSTAIPTSRPESSVSPTETVPPAVDTLVPTPTLTPMPAPVTPAEYQLTFEATWSDTTHPIDFPSTPHFSGLIGASHHPGVRLWDVEKPASPGVKNMAETGGKVPLDSEIDALIDAGDACVKISGGGINPSPGTVSVVFTVDQDCSAVSVVTMIAPSPDWFVGVSALGLLEDGAWVDQKIVELFPYDAGTDSGTSYTSPDLPTENPETIFRIESDPFLVDGSVPPLGKFTLIRLDG